MLKSDLFKCVTYFFKHLSMIELYVKTKTITIGIAYIFQD